MEDHERMGHHLGGRGVELWEHPLNNPSNVPMLSGGQRLDALMDEGREIWPAYQRHWVPGGPPLPEPQRRYGNLEYVPVPRIRNLIANQSERREPVRPRTRTPRNRQSQTAQEGDDFTTSRGQVTENERVPAGLTDHAEGSEHAPFLRYTEVARRGHEEIINQAHEEEAIFENQQGAYGRYGGARGRGGRRIQQGTHGTGQRFRGQGGRRRMAAPTPAPIAVPEVDDDGFETVNYSLHGRQY